MSTQTNSPPAPVSGPAAPEPRRRSLVGRVLRWVVLALLALLLMLGVALGAAWVWAGSDGSLATVLRLAGQHQPLVSEGVSGSLREGGQVQRLHWSQDGLSVELHELELRWTPAALWQQRRLHIDRLAASRVLVADTSQPDPDQPRSDGPPELPPVPLDVVLQELELGELVWTGPPEFLVHDVLASAELKNARLRVDLARAQAQDGHWQGRVLLDVDGPLRLDTVLAGALQVSVPGGAAVPALALLARVHGPLSELQARAQVHELDATVLPLSAAAVPVLPVAGADLPEVPYQEAGADAAIALQASARIMPWATQPLPEAQARFQALDMGALLDAAPRTRLSGTLAVQPVTQDGVDGWVVQVEVDNDMPGPWDAGELPLQALQADVQWLDGVAEVRQLQARLGGGTLHTQGRWVAPPAAQEGEQAVSDASQTGQTLGDWQLQTRLEGIDPSALHSELAPFALDGDIRVSGQDLCVDFDAHILPAQRQSRPDGAGATAQARALAQQLQSLRLAELKLIGSWNEPTLELHELLLRTHDAEISGTARAEIDEEPERMGGQARLSLQAPGLRAALDGSAWAERGDGQLTLEVQDAAQLLAWARSLPGADDVLRGWQIQGQTGLSAQWQGGWRKPQVKADLKAPRLSVQLPDTSVDQALTLRDLQLDVVGGLDAVQLNVQGQLQQQQRRLELGLQAAGRNRQPGADLAQAVWDMRLGPWRVSLHDPELGPKPWLLEASQAADLSWDPAQGGQLALQPGSVQLSNAGAPEKVDIAWGPLRWQSGELSSSGRLRGLPMAWVELLAGPALADVGVAGDVVFDGQWDVALGQQLRLQAELARVRGDVRLLNMGSRTEGQADLPLGLSDVHLRLENNGPDISARLLWDSTQAGRIEAEARTRLTGPEQQAGAGWDWPADAPLEGRVQLTLPQLSTWSLLAPPGWRLRGVLQGDLALSGTRDDPQLHGELGVERLALRSVVDGVQLGRGRLRARLQGTRLLIDEFILHGPGREGRGGSLTAQGEAGLIDGRTQAQLTARLDNLRASVRSDRQLALSGELQAGFADALVTLDGDLRVDQAWIELPDDSAPGLGSDVHVHSAQDNAGTKKTDDAAAEADANAPLRVQARVDVDLGDDFRLHGMGIDTRLAGLLKLRADGPLDVLPTLGGEIRTVDGSFRAYGQNLNIERGVIAFTGELDNPNLDILALRPNYTSDQRVGVLVQGNALLPQVRLYSMPQLSDNQTLSWLLLGRAAPESGAEAAMLQTAALAVLGGREGGGMAGKLGLDELGFNTGGDDGLAGSSLTMGKRLSDKLYAAYEHSLAGASGTLLIFYELSRRWSLRGQTGENSAVDLIFRLSFD